MTEIISNLISLGLTNNEATLYLALSTRGDMTGYECAKITGISRSNAYIALAGLCENGAAYLVDGATQKYSPAPIKEFCADKRRKFEAAAAFLMENMPSPAAPSEAYITISGASTTPNGRSTAIMLFPLDTSIPTAFMQHAPVNRFTMGKTIYPIADSICLLTRTLR